MNKMRYKDTYTISEITRNSIAKKYIYIQDC